MGLTPSLLPTDLRQRMAVLLPDGRTVAYQPKEKIFGEGEESTHIAILLSGIVKITASTTTGREALLGLRGSGEIVGEIAALYGGPRSATVRALDGVEARLIATSVFQQRLRQHPDALFAVLAAVIGRLRESDRRRLEFTGFDVLERVSLLLVELARTHGEAGASGAVVIGLRLSQEEIAGATGAKALRQLRNRGAVTTARQRIVILDLDALRPAL
jgi:CRP-like cAMP-binding protein